MPLQCCAMHWVPKFYSRGACRILEWRLRERHILEGLVVDGRLILKWMFWRCDGEARTR